MLRRTLAYILALVVVLLVVDFGVLREAPLYVNQLPLVDKALHFVMFGLLALLVNATLVRLPGWAPLRAIVTGSILVMIVATLEECSNGLVECRNFSLADLAANYLGIAGLGVLPLLWTGWRRTQARGWASERSSL